MGQFGEAFFGINFFLASESGKRINFLYSKSRKVFPGMIHGFIHKQLGSMIYHSHLTYAIFHILLNSYKT